MMMDSHYQNVVPLLNRADLRGFMFGLALAMFGLKGFAATRTEPQTALATPRGAAEAVDSRTTTFLPSGGVLFSGGANGSSTASALLLVQSVPEVKPELLPVRLHNARTGHSATVLPDGQVLFHGGRDAQGRSVAQSELLDLEGGVVEAMRPVALLERYQHVALVLSDGSLLIAGGLGTDGRAVSVLERFLPAQLSTERSSAALPSGFFPRAARLLPDGTVLLTSTTSSGGTAALLYRPDGDTLEAVPQDAARRLLAPRDGQGQMPGVTASLPAFGAADFGGDQPLMIRFTSPMRMSSLNGSTVSLIGPEGPVDLRVVPVDDGALAFLSPLRQLLPNSSYSLFVKGAADASGREMPMLAVSFKTRSLESTASSTDSAAASGVATSSAATNAGASQSLTASVQQQAGVGEDSEEAWVPTAQHRRGEWLSHRAYLAHLHLPVLPALRSVIEAKTPQVSDPIALKLARPASSWPESQRGASWSELQQGLQDQNLLARARATAASGADVVGTNSASLSGQLMRLNGLPLPNATLSIGKVITKTDSNGEFMLTGVPAGDQLLIIDGRSANTNRATYGRFEYRLQVESGRANILPFTVWMPKLDTKHAVRIDSPTKQDTVISTPSMPGFEVVLPKGTVIRDTEGKIVTEVTITPIPLDQSPYPVPFAGVPLNYTIQPGGAVIQGIDGKARGAVVRYPNYTSFGPKSPVRLFAYDPRDRGWYVYSEGQVSASGQTIQTDRDFLIYQFSTAMYSSGGPPSPPECGCDGSQLGQSESFGDTGTGSGPGGGSKRKNSADPVTGSPKHVAQDLYIDDVIPIDITRTYRGGGSTNGITPLVKAFGTDMTGLYEAYLYFDPGYKQIQLVMADGVKINFDDPLGTGGVSIATDSYDTDTFTSTTGRGEYRSATIRQNASISAYVLYFRDGRKWGFSQYSARLIWMEDRLGNRLTFTRPNTNAYVSRIASPHGRYVDISYNAAGLVSGVTDNIGRTVQYAYYVNTSNLQTVTDPAGKVTTYVWDATNHLQRVIGPDGNPEVNNVFEPPANLSSTCNGAVSTVNNVASGRVVSQTLPDGSAANMAYSSSAQMVPCGNGQLVLPPSLITQVTDENGTVGRYERDANLNLTKETLALGLPEQQVATSTYTNNLLTSRTDALGRVTTFGYDGIGNRTKISRATSTVAAGAVTMIVTYDPVFNLPLTVTDPLGHVRKFTYDSRGNLTELTDGLNHVTSIAYDDEGRPTSMTDPLLKTANVTYDGPDMATMSDPLGRTAKRFTDSVGRVLSRTDPLGNTTQQAWDNLNRISQITDALGGQTKFTYDASGRLLSHSDAKLQTTSYTYNAAGLLQSKTDALNRSETYGYSMGGQLSQRVDRKGQVSGITFDALGRVKVLGYGATVANQTAYTSTVSYTWDKGDRVTEIVDVSAAGTTTTTRSYDDLDRLVREVTDQGEINFTYDAAGRRASMTVKNGPTSALVAQPTVAYTWDAADHLTLLTQAAGQFNNNQAQTVAFQYDAAGRPIKTTYTNGLSVNTTYTDAGEVKTRSMLRADSSLIAEGSYSYDAGGRRIGISGDLAALISTQEPEVTGATYNAANQLTNWGARAFAYDANGNLISDGIGTYQWDERDRLVSVSSTERNGSSAYRYDSQGRRNAKVIRSKTTAYLYDGNNFVQELASVGRASAVTANLLAGGLDQHFLRETMGTDANGNPSANLQWTLPEANNSTAMSLYSDGSVVKTFAYTPYGNLQITPGASSDTQQYTGRENDTNGLYYYRNRYYMPGIMRFISEDPVGWASGQVNNYAYVGGNPISFIDPLGLWEHHIFPRSNWGGYSAEAQRYFEKQTVETAGRHGWTKQHSDYNKLTDDLAEKFCKSNKIKPSKMTEAQAKEMVEEISKNPGAKKFIDSELGPPNPKLNGTIAPVILRAIPYLICIACQPPPSMEEVIEM